MENKLSILCPIHNAKQFLPAFLNSLKVQTFSNFILIIIDDGSIDGSYDIIKEYYSSAIILKGDGNYWWTKSVNEGIKYTLNNTDCKYILLLNVDLTLEKYYLENMMKIINDSSEMILGSAVYDINTRKKFDLGWRINWLTASAKNNACIIFDDNTTLLELSVVSGRGMLIPRKIIENIGLLDEKRFPQYYADVAYSVKVKNKGFKIFCNNKAILYSHTNSTGITYFTQKISLKSSWKYFTSIKSPGKLTIRWKGALQIVPKKYLISFLVFDTLRIIGRYLKVFIK